MSIRALNWAIEACVGHGLNGNAKLVLWQIADAHNPDHGCFLSQETMATRVEISRATVNRCLDELEKVALIRRQARIHPVTKKQLPTRYFLAFEEAVGTQGVVSRVSNLDTASTGPDGTLDGVEVGGEPVDETGNDAATRVSKTPLAVSHSSETLTFLEPLTPLPPKPPTAVVTFDDLLGKWSSDDVGSVPHALRAFHRLDPAEQSKAVELVDPYRRAAYLLGRETPPLATYLNQRLFEELDGAPEVVKDGFRITPQRPEFKVWIAHLRRRNGEAVAARSAVRPFILTATRWPPDHNSHQSRRAG